MLNSRLLSSALFWRGSVLNRTALAHGGSLKAKADGISTCVSKVQVHGQLLAVDLIVEKDLSLEHHFTRQQRPFYHFHMLDSEAVGDDPENLISDQILVFFQELGRLQGNQVFSGGGEGAGRFVAKHGRCVPSPGTPDWRVDLGRLLGQDLSHSSLAQERAENDVHMPPALSVETDFQNFDRQPGPW